MKKITLLFAVAIISIGVKAQNFDITYGFDSVKATTGLIDPSFLPTATGVTFGSFSAVVGTATNPSGTGRFTFTSWSLGGVNTSTSYAAMTGALDTAKYIEVSISPNGLYLVNIDTIRFQSRRSATGARSYAVRSSLDGFVANLANAIIPTNTVISVQGTNEFFFNNDGANSTNGNGNTLILSGGSFSSLTDTVTFRIYGWNAESNAGTFGIDNFRIIGSATSLTPIITTQPVSADVCAASTASFSVAATNAVSYQWQEDAGSGFVSLANGGVYSGVDADVLNISSSTGLSGYHYLCIVTNTFGDTYTDTVSLNEVSPVTPSVTIPTDATICREQDLSGNAVGVNAGAAPTYLWYVVELGASPVGMGDSLFIPGGTIPVAATYHVYCQLLSNAGCITTPLVTSDTLTLVVNAADVPVINETADTLYTTSFATYQWYFGTTALGTDSTQTVTQSGIYTVVITDTNGCSNVSADYNFVFTGIDKNTANTKSIIYPNPSKDGMFTVDLGNQNTSIITVYNIIGKAIFTKEINTAGKFTVDLSSQANGCYFVTIKNEKENITRKITITK